MAGEDPGVGVITLLLDLVQRAFSAAVGTIKAVVSGIMDIVKTSLFFSWRMKMMQGQKGPDLKRGQQSLKDLRLHEQVGARIVSVEIGDREAMEALREELKRLELDFSITEHDDQFTLHYKESNEQDVLYAQQVALEKLYGGQDRDQQDEIDPNDEWNRDEQNRDEQDYDEREQDRQDEERQNEEREEDRDRDERREDDQNHDERSGREEQSGKEQDWQDRGRDDGQEREQQERENQGRQNQGQREDPTPVPIPTEVGERNNSFDDKAKRGKHARQEAPALAERMPHTPSHSQQAPKTQAQAKDAPQFEPLENLIAQARKRAAAKNAARAHAIDRTKDRVRAREVNFSH